MDNIICIWWRKWGEEGTGWRLGIHHRRGEGFIQVHHFKWDSTVLEAPKEVSETEKDYTFWEEYKKMYTQSKIMIGKQHWWIKVWLENSPFQMNIAISVLNRLTKEY